MRSAISVRRRYTSAGSTLVEFSLCIFLLMIVLLSIVEMSRMVLVYTAVSNAARAAARYAIVHGSSRTGGGVDGPSGPGANPPQVVQVATNFARASLIDPSRLTVTVAYTGGNNVGNSVQVGVSYSYDPFIGLIPVGNIPLSNVSRGVIVF
jgi:Flp pilus assembly protein TadG